MKTYEYDITEKQFDEYVEGLPLLYPDQQLQSKEECENPEYMLYGEALGHNVKFKNYKKELNGKTVDAFKICNTEEEFMHCAHCGIKYETKNHEERPVCKRPTRDIIDINRQFSDKLENYRLKLVKEYQTEMKEKYAKKEKQLRHEFGLV